LPSDVIGVDVGISKLLATSEEQVIGERWRLISARVRRRRPGSKRKRRARMMFPDGLLGDPGL
jgi:transposase